MKKELSKKAEERRLEKYHANDNVMAMYDKPPYGKEEIAIGPNEVGVPQTPIDYEKYFAKLEKDRTAIEEENLKTSEGTWRHALDSPYVRHKMFGTVETPERVLDEAEQAEDALGDDVFYEHVPTEADNENASPDDSGDYYNAEEGQND